MIQQRTLGRTGLTVSELCLGTLNFGWKTDEKRAFAILDAYHELGGNFIQAMSHTPEDSLPSTAVTQSETMVGRWWTSRSIRREDLFLATRISVQQPAENTEQAFARLVRDTCLASLRRLQTNYLDLVIFEWNDGLVPLRLTLESFDHLVRGGLTRYIGAGNFPAWRVSDCLARAYLQNHCRMEALQADYSLMTRARFEPETMALCREQRLAFFARSPLAGGFLARGRETDPTFAVGRRDWLRERFDNPYGDAALAALAEVAAIHDATTSQVALAWVLHNPTVTSAVIGVPSAAQLRELVDGAALRLTDADIQELDAATATEEVRVARDLTSAPRGELVLN